jgi:hypothetical protein
MGKRTRTVFPRAVATLKLRAGLGYRTRYDSNHVATVQSIASNYCNNGEIALAPLRDQSKFTAIRNVVAHLAMSASGHHRPVDDVRGTSALPLIATKLMSF